jgi:hypothetical protein
VSGAPIRAEMGSALRGFFEPALMA